MNSVHGIGLAIVLFVGPNPPEPSATERVAQVLQRYERAMCPLKSFEVDFTRTVYDSVFAVERHSNGRVYFEASGNARIEINPLPVEARSRGSRYKMMRGSFEKWIWKEGTIFRYIEPDKVERVRAPLENYESYVHAQNYGSIQRDWWSGFGAIYPQTFLPPVVTGAYADDLRQRFRIEFVKQIPSRSILSFFPLRRADLVNYRRMDVLFDDITGLPLAIKRYDTTGNNEEVIVFDVSTLKVNQPLSPRDDPLELQPNEFERLLREPIVEPR